MRRTRFGGDTSDYFMELAEAAEPHLYASGTARLGSAPGGGARQPALGAGMGDP